MVLAEALRQVEAPDMRDRFAFVLANAGWHAGVIGIVASRIVEHTARPAVLIAVEGETGKGSGRSIGAFDLHAGLSACRHHFMRFGGHRAAAGLTMEATKIPAFRDAFDEIAHQRLSEADLIPELRVDLDVSLALVGEDLEKIVRHFEPFGIGNPAPVFQSTGVRMAGPPKRIGVDGVRLSLDMPHGSLEAIGWGMAAHAQTLDVTRPLDLAFRLERDEYRGASRLQLKLADFRQSPERG